MRIRSVQNPLLPIVDHYDERGRKIATTYYDELTGIGTTYDANGKKIGTSVENPVTLITDYYDAIGRRTASSYHNDVIGATQYFDRDYKSTTTKWDNPITGMTSYEGDDLYAVQKEETYSSSSNGRPASTPNGSEDNTPLVRITMSPVDYHMGEEFARCIARSLISSKFPFDGSIYELSIEIRHTRHESYNERYTSDRPSDQLQDGFFLLQEKEEKNYSGLIHKTLETQHSLYILRGDGELLSGKYTTVDEQSYHSKTPARWHALDASKYVVDMIQNYVREKTGRMDMDYYGAFLKAMEERKQD